MDLEVWRICSKHRAASAFDGVGAKMYGGRWNNAGSPPVVYTATKSLALSVLEAWVHFDVAKSRSLVRLHATIPNDVSRETVSIDSLEPGWDSSPHPAASTYPALSQNLGDEWLAQERSCLLLVPSAITLVDFNCLINPNHRDFKRISIDAPTDYVFDPRMRKPNPPLG